MNNSHPHGKPILTPFLFVVSLGCGTYPVVPTPFRLPRSPFPQERRLNVFFLLVLVFLFLSSFCPALASPDFFCQKGSTPVLLLPPCSLLHLRQVLVVSYIFLGFDFHLPPALFFLVFCGLSCFFHPYDVKGRDMALTMSGGSASTAASAFPFFPQLGLGAVVAFVCPDALRPFRRFLRTFLICPIRSSRLPTGPLFSRAPTTCRSWKRF